MGLCYSKKMCADVREAAVQCHKVDKKLILDEFTQLSGCCRKYVITLLVHEGKRRLVRVVVQAIRVEA
jgi:hypothetical protein